MTLTLDLRSLYGLSDFDLREHWETAAELSPLGFCDALALKKGYRIARGRGGADTHRAGLEVRRDCYAQPEPPDLTLTLTRCCEMLRLQLILLPDPALIRILTITPALTP